ncbi:MAG: hypothetical protein ACRDGL_03520, partial [Candidatus Limnocylindrales bacterium]
VEAYMEAWESNRPDLAFGLLAHTGNQFPQDVADFWSIEKDHLSSVVATGETTYGPTSGLDHERPFSSLRVTEGSPNLFSVDVVRSETFQTKLLGLISTSGQRTVVVAPLLDITLQEVPVPGVLPSAVWRIEAVTPLP